jgi:hypothetical protein
MVRQVLLFAIEADKTQPLDETNARMGSASTIFSVHGIGVDDRPRHDAGTDLVRTDDDDGFEIWLA